MSDKKNKGLKGKLKDIFNDETEYLETQEIENELGIDSDDTFKVEKTKTGNVVKSSKSIVKVYEPVNKTATANILDAIKRGELCIINFSKLSEEESKVMYSTLSGSLYSLEGEMRMIDTKVVLCAPKNFLVDGEVSE